MKRTADETKSRDEMTDCGTRIQRWSIDALRPEPPARYSRTTLPARAGGDAFGERPHGSHRQGRAGPLVHSRGFGQDRRQRRGERLHPRIRGRRLVQRASAAAQAPSASSADQGEQAPFRPGRSGADYGCVDSRDLIAPPGASFETASRRLEARGLGRRRGAALSSSRSGFPPPAPARRRSSLSQPRSRAARPCIATGSRR